MKNLFLSFVLLLSSLCGSSSIVNDDLIQFLKVMEVPNDGTLPSIIEATQKAWKRPAGKERWHIENNLSETQAKAVMEYCSKNAHPKDLRLCCDLRIHSCDNAKTDRLFAENAYVRGPIQIGHFTFRGPSFGT